MLGAPYQLLVEDSLMIRETAKKTQEVHPQTSVSILNVKLTTAQLEKEQTSHSWLEEQAKASSLRKEHGSTA